MATSRIFFGSKPRYIYPTMEFDDGNLINNPSFDHHHHHHLLEFDEVDVWNNSNDQATTNLEAKKPLPSYRASSKKAFKKKEFQISDNNNHRSAQMTAASASLPVNIPDWSKILKAEYREHGKTDEDAVDGEDDGDRDGRVPPHEYLARRRGASFSVHEGIGRTLKGRDLRRVRNAVWKKTGFED
ncbi:uncharacterized protein LOC105799781 [Gossypium raimondii]|uniref:Senescence regulator n=1 Tax=Gossypium raimondii TaxID=29730 RepID=A0A0D2QBG6_GOSRA|nr:uncharacterized protein LOC105799781 [Gossypium raimondii]KJB36601.1 hypothetical protein B456_006G166600 [Gossypium raimondii]KJB36602.1 hypothetical protein B456_006G166600 [Gossypium raimondii]KJB36603.1 hypothetical protein B456_006G166600 [Gossypium raimondii]MBA0588044.1 hypothetical protein [Gossypium raimondii]